MYKVRDTLSLHPHRIEKETTEAARVCSPNPVLLIALLTLYSFKYIMQLEERLKNMEGLLGDELKNKESQESDPSHDNYAPFGVFHLETSDNTQIDLDAWKPMIARPIALGKETDLLENVAVTIPPSAQFQKNNELGRLMQDPEPSFSHMQPFPSWKGNLALGPFSLPSFHELPTKSVALELVNDSFASFNRFFPLFDEQDFLEQFHERYEGISPSSPDWWACINVVLSLAHRFRAMRTLETTYENAQSCGYMHNSLAVVSELSILHHSLPAVQALVGMAIILQGTPNPHAASVLIAAAVRLAQTMGLHRRVEDPNQTVANLEQRKRVFWIAYLVDKDISLRMGLPFAQDDDDMDAELPTGSPHELPAYSNGGRHMNFFKSRIGLAVIQGQIYKSLYSVQATRQSTAQKAVVAQELDCILCYWRSGVSMDFEVDPVTSFQGVLPVEFIHILILRFTYVNCLAMIDQHMPPTEQLPLDAAPDTQGLFTPRESNCIIESRKAIQLIQITPHGDYACVW